MGAPLEVRMLEGQALEESMPRLAAYVASRAGASLARHPGWLRVLRRGLGHQPYCLEAFDRHATRGILPLCFVRSALFGRFLVGLPYLNIGGVLAEDSEAQSALIDEGAALADRLNVRYLELRHEQPIGHPVLGHHRSSKVHMRLELPGSTDALWGGLDPKVRNQVRAGQKAGLEVVWGGQPLLGDFYAVFAHNMRDLGTPVYGKRLFGAILDEFPEHAELCVVRQGRRPVAAALLVHGTQCTEVPSASSLRRYKRSNANMLMYWHLLCRAVARGQRTFDFGRSSVDSGTFRFKRQWGAEPAGAHWQYYLRRGSADDMRPENARFGLAVRLWRHLPVWLTRWLGPAIVRGIP